MCDPLLTSNPNENYFTSNQISKEELSATINLFDLKRLEAYSKNLVDYHLIIDLVP